MTDDEVTLDYCPWYTEVGYCPEARARAEAAAEESLKEFEARTGQHTRPRIVTDKNTARIVRDALDKEKK